MAIKVACSIMCPCIAIYSLMIANLTCFVEETGRKRRELAELPKETGPTASEEDKPSS
ncbi:MAG: hypothetical protein GQ467_02015 [Mariprofundaceae bacterium]|nr:hypothetical protein [Mariprofundaceae bacterium]